MPISGLVITFASPVTDHQHTVDSIGEIPEVELGDASGGKLAIVVDSSSKRRDQEIWTLIQKMSGVIDVAVAMIVFDDQGEASSNDSERDQR